MKVTNLQGALQISRPSTVKMENGDKFTTNFILLNLGKATPVFFHSDEHFEIIEIKDICSIRSATR